MENTQLDVETLNSKKNIFFEVTPISKILATLLFITLPFIGFWLGTKYVSSPVDETNNGKLSEQNQSQNGSGSAKIIGDKALYDSESNATNTVKDKTTDDLEGIATTTVTAYIVAIKDREIVLDYVDVFTGQEAVQHLRADGFGYDERDIALYDRNTNPRLRTFTAVQNINIVTNHDTNLTLNELSKGGYLASELNGRYSGSLFAITLNNKNEIVDIKGIFRP